ncbi:uncharacterized protein THITE_123357 [Thermothielavioides terrestris NRRL 8126]|uniref:Gfo/Idh/MocA-like oxidoreductase N-terminal domain-containing protein n=1 Tax=Thermothielavioides terrestris (strain ATCC 38088 / NRRL 8126) TaxID=578455 RepID=G2QVS2_THETT|nr:uncharacterized protein THITE_123357 [Thermothielavioides terrestris NRRL 8126]AEO63853.1 hypothetical protein THITE_123357 [Thermothielavioides terrestris NRRL 8126]
MVGIALLGAGIFAREEHLPAIEATPSLTLKAVYSRSQRSAEALAAACKDPSSVAVYYDEPATLGKSLSDLLARADVAAVDVVLPILRQPDVVRAALQAGKHVLSEKPVAGDVAAARALIGWYEAWEGPGQQGGAGKPLWGVAENWRFMESLRYAARRVGEIGGQVVSFRLVQHGFMREDNKYFNTEWRKTPAHQGGFLLDAGVHFVAGLRFLLAAAGQSIRQLAGFTALLNKPLVPVDTVHAAAVTQDGKPGTITMSFGTEFKSAMEIEIVTTKGAVVWSPTEVKTTVGKGDGSGDTVEEKKEFPRNFGVAAEVAAFAQAVEAGELDRLQSPSEAFIDLEILQALLESGAGGGVVKTIGA